MLRALLRFDAEPLEEIALRHRAVHARADVLCRARERLEIDMGGDVGLTRILQGIGEAVTGDGLKRVAGIAAQMAAQLDVVAGRRNGNIGFRVALDEAFLAVLRERAGRFFEKGFRRTGAVLR